MHLYTCHSPGEFRGGALFSINSLHDLVTRPAERLPPLARRLNFNTQSKPMVKIMTNHRSSRRIGMWQASAGFAVALVVGACLCPASAAAHNQTGLPSVPGPGEGIYLGAWVNPKGLPEDQGDRGQIEIDQLPDFNSSIGRSLAILHIFAPIDYGTTSPTNFTAVLNEIEQNGSVPIVDMGCNTNGGTLADVANGVRDVDLYNYAKTLAKFGQPLFFRWFWEMNAATPDACRAGLDDLKAAAEYKQAWVRIYQIFHGQTAVLINGSSHTVNAPNVAFVWCPRPENTYGRDTYYPGDTYVDWVAGDGFDHSSQGNSDFDTTFGDFYTHYNTIKPIMIAATGAQRGNQVVYIQDMQQNLPSKYPGIKAVIYFDAPGGRDGADLSLDNSGLAAFTTMANLAYFSYGATANPGVR